jgi:cytochrome c biogenesis factor
MRNGGHGEAEVLAVLGIAVLLYILVHIVVDSPYHRVETVPMKYVEQ